MSRIALATVVSEEFLAGALVMIESFQQANSWFSGDIVIIDGGLKSEHSDLLGACFPGLVRHEISEDLTKRMEDVRRHARWTGNKHLQFASLEALALEGYDRVVFCDSDLLFTGSIAPLLELASPLICCGDGCHFRGNERRIADFVEVPPEAGDHDSIGKTFNSGLMVLGSELISRDNYHALLDMMAPGRWEGDATGHTDQMLLNLHFAGQQEIVSSTYNYMISHRKLIESATSIKADQAKVLHFTGPHKPWLPIESFEKNDVDREYFAAFSKWRAALQRLDRRLEFDLLSALEQL